MSSGFRNIFSRIRLRIADCLSGETPHVARSGQHTGVTPSKFDDVRTIVFGSASNVIPSLGLQSGSHHIPGITLPPLITSPQGAHIRRGVADEFISGTGNGHVHQPYKEIDRFELSTGSFFSGSHRFDSRLGSKSSFKIDISNTREQVIARNAATAWTNDADPSGSFYGQDLTGFCYYNFDTKRWDQIGLRDPETGLAMKFDDRLEVDGAINNTTPLYPSQTINFPMQFSTIDNWRNVFIDGMTETDINSDESSYNVALWDPQNVTTSTGSYVDVMKSCASPTVTAFAPFANRYHATSSQRIRMSDYISRPFRLEKVVVRLDMQAETTASRRELTGSDYYDTYSRLQDDLIFFLYRQSNDLWGNTFSSTPISKQADFRGASEFVTGSQRYLICSGVASFYKSRQRYQVPNTDNPAINIFQVLNYEPLNTPSFKHDWGFSEGEVLAGAKTVKTFSGSVEIRADVAITNEYLSNNRAYPWKRMFAVGANWINFASCIDYWPGGTSCKHFGPTGSHGKVFTPSFKVSDVGSGPTPTADFLHYGDLGTGEEPLSYRYPSWTAFKSAIQFNEYDPRVDVTHTSPLTSTVFAENDLYQPQYKSFAASKQQKASYLLLPTDELVFGLETNTHVTNLNWSATAISGSPTAVSSTNHTGTIFRISTGDMSLTFYGEYIKGGDSTESLRFDNTTTPSVTTFVGEEISDQFDIATRSERALSNDYSIFVGDFFHTREVARDAITSTLLYLYTRRRYRFVDTNTKNSERYYRTSGQLSYALDYELYSNNRPSGSTGLFDFNYEFNIKKYIYYKCLSSERMYDSMQPPINVMLSQSSAVKQTYYQYSTTPTNKPDVSKFDFSNWKVFNSYITGSITASCVPTLNDEISSSFAHFTRPYFGTNGELSRVDESEKVSLVVPYDLTDYKEAIMYGIPLKFILFTRGCEGNYAGNILSYFNSNFKFNHDKKGSWGFAYGVGNISPQHSSAIFRRTHYGHFRDMLEQRLDTAFYVKKPAFVGKVSSPVTVKFFSGSVQVPPASASYSSNRSVEATSSICFDDSSSTYTNWGSVI